MINAELIALLREAREALVRAENRMMAPPHQVPDVIQRIDAALAEGCPDCGHQYGQQEYCQGDGHAAHADSATLVVESEVKFTRDWHTVNSPNRVEALLNGGTRVSARRADVNGTLGWLWDAEIRPTGFALTLDEAKSAAITAARGMR